MNQQNKKKKINIKLDEKVGEGVYSNMAVISFSQAEFIMDFGRILPGLKSGKILSRVISTPQKAKQLLMILEKNIENYEKKYGSIKVSKDNDKQIGFKNE